MNLIIFDVDGTLVDSRAFAVETQRRTFFAHGLTPPSDVQGLSLIGLSLHVTPASSRHDGPPAKVTLEG